MENIEEKNPLWRNGQIPANHELGDPDNLQLHIKKQNEKQCTNKKKHF